ncbi:MAG: hypothetical protein ACEPOV_08225 [Hyphomicrobiales bacterium]
MKNKILLILLLLKVSFSFSQERFLEGYVIKNNHDTIHGYIEDESDLYMKEHCNFKKDIQSNMVKYSPEDVRSFRIKDSKFYTRKEINDQLIFLEYLVKGQINIYYYQDKVGDHYFIQNDTSQLVELPYKEYITWHKKRDYQNNSKRHIGVLKYFMQDAPQLFKKLDAFGKPSHKNLIRITERYHKEVCSGKQCIVFEKSPPYFHMFVELTTGPANIYEIKKLADSKTYYNGANIYINLFKGNKKFYFKTGLLYGKIKKYEYNYSTNEYDIAKVGLLKVPIQFVYTPFSGMLRPKISLGCNMYNQFKIKAASTLGLDLRITNNLFINLTGEMEFTSSTTNSTLSSFSESLRAGILFRLF